MSERLDPGDRLLLIGAGALLALAALLAVLLRPGSEAPEELQVPSSYETSSGGAKATWMLLQQLGYDVRRWEQAPNHLPLDDSMNVVLVLAQPSVRPTTEERESIGRFVVHGGRLLVAGEADSLAPGADIRPLGDPWHLSGRHAAAEPMPRAVRRRVTTMTRRAPGVELHPLAAWQQDVEGADTLYTCGADPAVVAWTWERGSVVWWSGTTPLTNRGLERGDNLALLLDALGPPGRTVVLWDEYFHGERGTVMGYLARTPLRWGALQALLLFAAVCLAFARRTGPVRVPATASRASLLEFVDALGGLYGRAGATRAVVKLALDDFRLRLVRRLGVPAGTSDEALVETARRRLGHGDPTLVELLARARRVERMGIDDEDALALVRGLDRWDRLWRNPAARDTAAPPREGAST